MKKQICPICDQVMKRSHYCSHCRKFVRNPIEREVGYYLNEQHSAGEGDCTYHQPMPGRELPVPNLPDAASVMHQTAPAPIPAAHQAAPAMPPPNQAAGQNKKPKRPVVAIIVAIMISFMGLTIFINMFRIWTASIWSATQRTYDVDLGDYYEEDLEDEGIEMEELQYEFLTDEEVIAAGVGCNGSLHFEIGGLEFADSLELMMAQYGFVLSQQSTESSNEQYEDGSTWFSTWDDFLYENAEADEVYILLETDTATNQIHSIYLSTPLDDMTVALTEAILGMRRQDGEAMYFNGEMMAGFDPQEFERMTEYDSYSWRNDAVSLEGDFYYEDPYMMISPVTPIDQIS